MMTYDMLLPAQRAAYHHIWQISSPVNPCLHVLTAGGLKMKCEKPVSTLKNNINFSFQLLSRLSWTYGQNTEKLSLIIHYDHPV